MKRTMMIQALAVLLAFGFFGTMQVDNCRAEEGAAVEEASGEEHGKWGGVDESVVEKFATEAGRPPRDPYINTDQGDLLLFVFLVAGILGGFMMGYYYIELFGPNAKTAIARPQ